MSRTLKAVFGTALGVMILSVIFIALLNRGAGEIRSLQIDDIDLSLIGDGTYVGTYSRGRWNYTAAVAVVDHTIIDVRVTGPMLGAWEESLSQLRIRILESQSPSVDTISGATVTSKAILKAVENALSETNS